MAAYLLKPGWLDPLWFISLASRFTLDSDRFPILGLEFVFDDIWVVIWRVVYGEPYWREAVHSLLSISFVMGAKIDAVLPLCRIVDLQELSRVGDTPLRSGCRKKSQPRFLTRLPFDLNLKFSLAASCTEGMDICKAATALGRTQPAKKPRW
jgi:hypothetical protein